MMDRQFIIKRTIYEEYELDPYVVLRTLSLSITDDFIQNPAGYLIELFEKYDGSVFGDNLMGQLNVDTGYEVIVRTDDEPDRPAGDDELREAAITYPPCSRCGKPWQDHYREDQLRYKNGPHGSYGLIADHTPHIPGLHADKEGT